MSSQQNRPDTPTEESTEAISPINSYSTTSLVSGTVLPTVNQLILKEVAIFLGTKKQSTDCPEDVEMLLLHQINERLLGENKKNGLRGRLAHSPLKVLPPSVIATCILDRELRHTGLIGESEATAELVTYEDAGPDEGLYVPAEQRIRRLARQYHCTISPKDLNAVVEHVRDSVPLLVESKDGDVVALANGLFDLHSKELRPFSPEVVLTSKASVAFREDATTCPVIDGWSIDSGSGSLRTMIPRSNDYSGRLLLPCSVLVTRSIRLCSCTPLPDRMARVPSLSSCAISLELGTTRGIVVQQ